MKIYKNKIQLDNEQDFFYQLQCAEIVLELRTLCEELYLNFQDFKEAFIATKISYKDIKSFERVLTNGWPPDFFQNDKKRENFLNATEKALENCANGEYPLKRSDFESVKNAYSLFFKDVKDYCEMKKIRTKPLKEVDEVIGELFNINISYASDFRKLLFPNSKCKEKDNLHDKCFNQYKISHFRYDLMVSECKNKNIHLFNEMRDGMLLLSTYALPVSEILNGTGKYEIHADFKRELENWTNEIDKIMQGNPDLKAAIYMYLHQFRENDLVWWLLATLPSIDKEKVEEWIHVFDTIPSEKSILEMMNLTERCFFLLDFKNKLPRLNAKILKNVYDNVTGYDLQCAYLHIDYFKQFSRTPLRQDDIYLTYLIISTLEEWPQELMIEQIASASKANIPLKFCPADEITVDWKTQTAWSTKWVIKQEERQP